MWKFNASRTRVRRESTGERQHRNLPGGMHARIRPPGHHAGDGGPGEPGGSRFQHLLHRQHPVLPLPAGEWGSVILYEEGKPGRVRHAAPSSVPAATGAPRRKASAAWGERPGR